MIRFSRAARPVLLACCAMLMALAVAAPAHAWWRGGVWIGVPPLYVGPPAYYPPPYYYPPPVYAPPPVVYAQPPAVYAPPAAQSLAPDSSGQQACYAGAYTCPINNPVPSGSSCFCQTNQGARAWGRAG